MPPIDHADIMTIVFVVKTVVFPCRPAVEEAVPLQAASPYNSNSETESSIAKPKKKRAGRPRRADGHDYDTDYASSGDELDDDDFSRYKHQRHQPLTYSVRSNI